MSQAILKHKTWSFIRSEVASKCASLRGTVFKQYYSSLLMCSSAETLNLYLKFQINFCPDKVLKTGRKALVLLLMLVFLS